MAESNPSVSSPSPGKAEDPLETAKWTRHLPEAFGIREAVRQSSYRWCVREGYVDFSRMLSVETILYIVVISLFPLFVVECGALRRGPP